MCSVDGSPARSESKKLFLGDLKRLLSNLIRGSFVDSRVKDFPPVDIRKRGILCRFPAQISLQLFVIYTFLEGAGQSRKLRLALGLSSGGYRLIAEMTSAGPTAPTKKALAMSKMPNRRSPSRANRNLGDEEAIPPSNQVRVEQSGDEDDHIGGNVNGLAQEFSNLADEKLNRKASLDTLQQVALTACAADFETWGDLAGATEIERDLLVKTMSAGQAHVMRGKIATTQPGARMPDPATPQFPEINFGSAPQNAKSDCEEIRRGLILPQEAADFFTKLQSEAAATGPPFVPYPAPDIRAGPWTPRAIDVKRAIEAESAKQKQY